MKTNIFTNKLQKNGSIKPKTVLDSSLKKKNKEIYIKKGINFNKNNKEQEQELSFAYKNINLILSNCLETIKAEEKKEEQSIINPLFKNTNNLIKNNEMNSISKNIDKNSSILNNLNDNLSLSNSNIILKHSEKNILNNLNFEPQKKFNKTKTVKSNIKKTISMNNNNSNFKNNIGNLILKNTLSLFAPRRSITKQQYSNFKKNEYIFDLNKNSVISNKIENTSINENLLSPGSIKKSNINKKFRRGLIDNENYYKSKTFFVCDNNLINKEKSTKKKKRKLYYSKTKASNKNSDITINSKNSQISKSTLNKKRKRSKSIFLTSNNFNNIFEQNSKKNSLFYKNGKNKQTTTKDNLKFLSLKEIEKNIRKTIIDYEREKIKQQKSELEKNNHSETIKNLPKKDIKEKNINTSKNSNNAENKENTSIKNETYLLNEIKEKSRGNLIFFQPKYRKLFISKKVYDSLDDEEIEEEKEINNFYLSPNSFYIYFIDSLTLISSFIELFYLPFLLAYNNNLPINSFISIDSLLFYLIDLIYIIDLISGFFRAYYNFEEYLIRNINSICINYLKRWFFIDFIEAIPFYTIFNLRKKDFYINKIYNKQYNSGIYIFSCSLLHLKILKILKIFSENRTLKKIAKILNKNDFFYNWSGIFFYVFFTLSSLNFCSLYFIFLGKNIYPGWIVENKIQNNSFLYIYIISVYYIMTTLTTVGYGDTLVTSKYETIYKIAILIVGTCAYSWIISFISNYIKKRNEQFIDFEKKVKILEEIKINYNLKNDLYERILRYLIYNKSELKFNVEYILESLPISLKNNLIVEMYKPIIKNFYFFKSFENSNFFVKIVTSLKPILVIKDDILIQEGDVVEDIIFIKNGILTLEILIDLDEPKKSAEAHLNMAELDNINNLEQSIKTEQDSKIFNSNSILSLNTNLNYSNLYTKYNIMKSDIKTDSKENKNKNNIKELKIIDLRKNEHYGDILMILNMKSPLTVKVTSKKAELFLLEKTEATEISNDYPNIWKRIVSKSLYNMKEIKNIIRKKIIIFCDLNCIPINPELKNNYLDEGENFELNIKSSLSDKKTKTNKNHKNNIQKSPTKQIDTIILEEDENFDSPRKTYVENEQNKQNNKINFPKHFSSNQLNNKVKNNENINLSKTLLSFDKKINKNNDLNDEKKLNFIGESNHKTNIKNENNKLILEAEDNQDIKTTSKNNSICNINNMISIIDEKMKSSKGQINNFSINIFTPKTVHIPITQINNNHINNVVKNSESDVSNRKFGNYEEDKEKINEEININDDFKFNIMKNDISMHNSDKNENFIYPNLNKTFENIKKEKLKNFKKNLYKLLDYNINNKKNNNVLNKDNNISNKTNRFSNLNNSKTISFTIYSTYENLNQISEYKYPKNLSLRLRIKNIILENLLLKPKNKEINHVPNNLRKTKGNYKKYNSSISNNYDSEIGIMSPIKGNGFRKNRFYSIDNLNIPLFNHNKYKKRNNSPTIKNQKNHKNSSSIILSNYNIFDERNSLKKKSCKKPILNRAISEIENEECFSSKINSFRKGAKEREKEKEKDKDKDKDSSSDSKIINLEKQISQNIEKNQQNLRNPEEYFSGFFNDILLRRNVRYLKMNSEQKINLNFKTKKESNNHLNSNKNKNNFEFDLSNAKMVSKTVDN